MGRFVYQVRDNTGKNESGVLTAKDADEAVRVLRAEGKTVVHVHQESDPAQVVLRGSAGKKVNRDDVIFFATQLAVMVDTGVQLTEALDSIARQTRHPGLKAMIQDISDQVKGGTEFSIALEKYPKVFGNVFVSLVRASEASGTMGQMLQRVSDYLTQERDTRKQVRGAMTYPMCMLGFCLMVVTGLLVFILPRFERIYAGNGAVLPLPTRALMGLSHAIVNYWPFIVGLLVAGGIGMFFYLRTPAGRIALDTVRIFLPLVGPMYRKTYLARSLRTMATMVSTGVSVLEGLEISARVAGNYHYSRLWKDLAAHVKQGSTLADHLYSCRLIPCTLAQMVEAGERTGRLAMVMNRIAQFCEDDLKVAVKTLTNMIEPVMIIVMGLIVGGIAMALLLPVFSLSKIVAH